MAENVDRQEFFKSSSSRDTIVNCIADLEGSPDRDYSNYCIDSLYHTTLRFAETFELDESLISLISEAGDMVFECHIDNELLNTLVCPQLFTGYPGRSNLKFQKRFDVSCLINDLRSRKRRLFLESNCSKPS